MHPTIRKTSLFMVGIFFACSLALGAPPTPLQTIHFIIPKQPIRLPGERNLDILVEQYNQTRAPGSAQVQLIRRGNHFSALREFMALHLTGETPEIAAIEATEFQAIERIGLALPIPTALVSLLKLKAGARTLPFQLALPILVADQEVLYRVHAERAPLPTRLADLSLLTKKLSQSMPGSPPLALPLQGPRALWFFEALSGQALWKREPGGLRTNRNLEKSITEIQGLSTRADMNWDRALDDFLDRKVPLAITSSDALPLLGSKASFKWRAAALAGPAWASGSHLIVTRNHPDILKFLEFLYSRKSAARWAISEGFLPLREDWKTTPEWSAAPPAYRQITQGQKAIVSLARATDPDVIRVHTEWLSALGFLFGPTAKRLPIETVFTQLDTQQ